MRKLFSILLLFIAFPAYASTSHYAIVVDAGSSGSRLHLFQYDDSKPLPVISDIFSENVSPGLSSFATQPENAGASLKKLFDDAKEKLAAQQINPNDVTVDVLATAGMRLLPNDAQQAIYNDVRKFLTSHYTFRVGDIETISGKMEGVYGWLDINYLAERFNSNNDITYGAIDMGGASSEIAFATIDNSKIEDEVKLTIAGKSYTVFSKSFLGAGQDKTREAMNANTNAGTCYPNHYSSNNIAGQFNQSSCNNIYTTIISSFYQQGSLPSLAEHEFIAYSGIYYAFHFLDADQTPSKANVTNRIQTVCNKPWEQLKNEYSNVAEKYLATYCANSVYHVNLLFDSYQLQDQQLHVQNKINNKDIDWTLGALLYELII